MLSWVGREEWMLSLGPCCWLGPQTAAGMVGEQLPNSLLPGDPHPQEKQMPKSGLKAEDGGGNKGTWCPSLGQGDMAWRHCPGVGAWVSSTFPCTLSWAHSLRNPPGFPVAEGVSPLSAKRSVGSAQPDSILTVPLPFRVWSQLLHQYLLLFPPQIWVFWTACF